MVLLSSSKAKPNSRPIPTKPLIFHSYDRRAYIDLPDSNSSCNFYILDALLDLI